jgi:mono/diheme cytochrome c family protein
MDDGTGLPGIIPPLMGSDYLSEQQPALPCLIRNGIEGLMVVNGRSYQTAMPGIPQLTEFEITNVINYVNTAWGNAIPPVRHPDVREQLENCP